MEADHSPPLSFESEKALPFMAGPPSAVRTVLLALVVFVMCYLADALCDTTIFIIHNIYLIGLANGLLVALMLLMPRRTWPVIIAAGVAADVAHNIQFDFTPWAKVVFALNATIEFLIIGLGLGYSFDGVPRLNSLKALGKYCFFAVFLAPSVFAFISASAIPGSFLFN
jgi:integral membrane sensor domain MASE1